MRTKYSIQRLARKTGFSVGEIASAFGFPLYDQRTAQGLRRRKGRKECMPSHNPPRCVILGRRAKKGAPGVYRAILEVLGRGDQINVPGPQVIVPWARRDAIRHGRMKRAAIRRGRERRAGEASA
jgi:hypothetical protein